MSADTSVFAYSGVFEPFVKLSAFMTVFITSEERAKCNSQLSSIEPRLHQAFKPVQDAVKTEPDSLKHTSLLSKQACLVIHLALGM